MTVKEYYENHTPHSPEDEQRLLQHYDYLSVAYDQYLRVARHRDGRYFVVDYNGDMGIDEGDQDLQGIVEQWYSKAH